MKDDTFSNWNRMKLSLQEKFPELNSSDMEYTMGQEEELLSKLADKLKKNKDEIRNWLSLMG